ncbi:MAG: CrcB family protein [Actinobacteria bacterium]|nr:CrcB family protein [Actinomycetota bacterium]
MPDLVFHALAALAAGLGAVCRLLLDGAISATLARRAGRGGSLPWGTLAVNFSGSLLIGVVAGLLIGTGGEGSGPAQTGGFIGGVPVVDSWSLATSLGFLGGYTTFSTASYQTVRLLEERRWALALGNSLGQLMLTVGAAALGWWIAASLVA